MNAPEIIKVLEDEREPVNVVRYPDGIMYLESDMGRQIVALTLHQQEQLREVLNDSK